MANIAIIIGTGPFGEDILYKQPWIEYLDRKHEIHVVSRIKPQVHYNRELLEILGEKELNDINYYTNELLKISSSFNIIHDSTYIHKIYSKEEIIELEKQLGISLNFIGSLDKNFHCKRQDIHFNQKRNNFTACLVDLFKDFFVKNDINIFINSIEDDVVSVVAYYVAKKLDIEVIGFVSGRFPKKGFMFAKDFSDVYIWNKQNISWNMIISMYDTDTIAGEEILQRNTGHWDLLSIPKRLKGLKTLILFDGYTNKIGRVLENEKFIFNDFNRNNAIMASKDFAVKFIRKNFLSHYFKARSPLDKFLLFPLHYMDDAQITFREPFFDQFKLINEISRAMPEDYYLYIKPHPHFYGTDLSLKEVANLSRLGNIKLIDPSIPPMDLIKNSKGLITINSTAGFEALIMGVDVLTFGSDFYCKKKLCYIMRDMNELPRKLMNMLNENEQLSREKIVQFIKEIYVNTIWITGINYDYGFNGLTTEDGRNIASVLNNILKNLREGFDD
jgi:capsule polysaccharide modification protein KpsS